MGTESPESVSVRAYVTEGLTYRLFPYTRRCRDLSKKGLESLFRHDSLLVTPLPFLTATDMMEFIGREKFGRKKEGLVRTRESRIHQYPRVRHRGIDLSVWD